MLFSKIYFQPYAFHRQASERLVLQDESGLWYLWIGEPGNGVIEVPAKLAFWIIARPEMDLMPAPCMWFELDALPVASAAPVVPSESESTIFGD